MHPFLIDPTRLHPQESRSISSENRDGARAGGGRAPLPTAADGRPVGPARDLGPGWKVQPCDEIDAGETFVLADIAGPGCIRHIWLTPNAADRQHPFCGNRSYILRVYYDDQERPSVEVPMGDFFAAPFQDHHVFAPLSSLAVCVNPGSAFNCYWPMPFARRLRMTLENRDATALRLFFQIDYTLGPAAEEPAFFHAQFRRSNPVADGVHTILDGVAGRGHYVGTALGWQVNHDRWWGEGEVKFYIDGDADPAHSDGAEVAGSTGHPTICTTGTEDYFCGSYNFEDQTTRRYREFCTPYAGLSHVVRPDGLYRANQRFALYRWHLPDPIFFRRDLRVTVQALGWRKHDRYLRLADDLASVAYWYQALPTTPFPPLDSDDALELT